MSQESERRALYLRWRPGRFRDVLGQEHVVRTLRNAVASGGVAHAYLFCGPRGTGKTSIARILFKALNCERPEEGDACGACDACQEVASGRALDLVEIDAASNRGIDHIRDLRERVWISPSSARRKMYILDEAHQLSAPAWDAFLKTLEEPPPHVVFVMATTEVHKVPATILSRCQRFDLGRIALADLVQHLQAVLAAEAVTAEPAVLQRVARLSQGGVRDALSTLDQLIAFGGASLTLDAARVVLGFTPEESLHATVDALAAGDAHALLDLVGALARDGADLRQYLDDLVDHIRALLLARLGAADVLTFEYGAEEQAALAHQATGWDPARLTALIRRLTAVEVKGRDAGQLQVQVELALLEAALGADELPARLAPAAPMLRAPAARPRAVVPARSPTRAAAAPVSPPASAPSAPAAAAELEAPDPPPPLDDTDYDDEPEAAARDLFGRQPAAPQPAATATNGDAALPAPAPAASKVIDLGLVRHRWTEIKEVAAVQFPMAGIALEAATIAGFEDGHLLLAFTSDFHRDTVESDHECRATVERLLGEQLGAACRLRCVAAAAHQASFPGDDWLLAQAVQMFGAAGVERVDSVLPVGEER